GTDELYQPTSWVFYALQFLDKFKQPVNANVQQVNVDTHDGTDSEVQGEQFPTPAAPTASRSSILPPPPPKKRRVLGPTAKQNELLQKACSSLDQPKEPQENIPTITKAWGEKLNTLDPQQRALAEKAISDIIFEVSQGTLHRYSVEINEYPVYGTISSLTSFPITSLLFFCGYIPFLVPHQLKNKKMHCLHSLQTLNPNYDPICCSVTVSFLLSCFISHMLLNIIFMCFIVQDTAL
ncbi:uncharacterized protein LOC111871705, partial [Cryptotermes secundus]|uniref:uncharacterized protein LOC111871705 n=1 Tax=Cryptotermes secundus TaxID=105785 RepID=UPI000CD7D486